MPSGRSRPWRCSCASCCRGPSSDTAPCLYGDTYLGVPRLNRLEPPGTYWVVPPRYDGDLCSPQLVRELVDAGRRQLAPDEPE